MNSIIETMLSRYNPQNNDERENAIKEIIQEIVLAGLSRGGFFEKAAFYGGTCLRIFYGLNRFSEDLDFALINKDNDFQISNYFPYVRKELLSYGLDMEVSQKQKNGDVVDVQSAFVKGNTLMLLMNFYPSTEEVNKVIGNKKIKVKFEVDIDNPSGGIVETKYRLQPSPYQVSLFDETTLFAGKIHAIICREYNNRIKGRDFYDYLFYCSKKTKINIVYLENKLKNSGKIQTDIKLNINLVKKLLKDRFETIDYRKAIEDVSNFIKDTSSLAIWSKDLFISTLGGLEEK